MINPMADGTIPPAKLLSYADIRSHGACAEALAEVPQWYPEGFPLSEEAVTRLVAHRHGWALWLLHAMAPAPVQVAYERATVLALTEYTRAAVPSLAEYQRTTAPALVATLVAWGRGDYDRCEQVAALEAERELDAKRREVTQLRSELIASDALRRGAERDATKYREAFEASERLAKVRLADAERRGAREALTRLAEAMQHGTHNTPSNMPWYAHSVADFRDREYPAVPPECEGAELPPHELSNGRQGDPIEWCARCRVEYGLTPPQATQSIVSTDGLGHTTTVHINPATITPTYTPPQAAPEPLKRDVLTFTPDEIRERIASLRKLEIRGDAGEAEGVYVRRTDVLYALISDAQRLVAVAQTTEG